MFEDENIGVNEPVFTEQENQENEAQPAAEGTPPSLAETSEKGDQEGAEGAEGAAQANAKKAEPANTTEQTPQERTFYAEQRRKAQLDETRIALAQARAQAEQAQREKNQAQEALSHFFTGDSIDALVNDAMAKATGKTPQEVALERKRQDEVANALSQKEQELAVYRQRELERAMKEDLASIKRLNPNVKSLEELGEPYFKLISAGVDAITAYNAVNVSRRPKPKVDTGGKDHLITTGGSAGSLSSIPPSVLADYKSYGFSEKEAAEDYQKNIRKGQ